MFKSTSTFDKLLERATSLTNLEPDWNAILAICDTIRQNDVQPKYAVNAIKKKLYATNPNVELLALQVLESCVKNCGSTLHIEITSKAFMEELREIIKMSSDSKVRDEILKLIQVWAHAFRNDPTHRAVQDTVNLMKIEGYKFPVLKESDAMFAADSAPEWADGECCNRCRTQFSMVNRKHHCRNCGQIFCHKCSSKLSTIPKYGIEKEVRVCDDCFDKLNKGLKSGEQSVQSTTKTVSANSSEVSSPFSSVKTKTEGNTKTEREIQEEEELQLALALSQSEAESKERDQRNRSLSASSSPYGSSFGGMSALKLNQKSSISSSKTMDSSVRSLSSNNIDDPELSRYLNRDFWEQKSINSHSFDGDSPNPMPSAPQPQQYNMNTTALHKNNSNMSPDVNKLKDKMSNGIDEEMEAFLSSLRSAIEIFVNRINSNQLRGRPIANDSAVQSLFMNITNMHSNLLAYIQQQDDSRSHFESLQDKLGQIRDARAALDALREEHREQLRREAEEAEILRQQQMAQKLEIMRKKKQEYLQYQREIALQRMQEQEREMLIRQEQHKYIPVWQHSGASQPVPQMMYSNGPQTAPQNYIPYVNPSGPPTQNTNPGNPYIANPMPNPNNTGPPNVQMYAPQTQPPPHQYMGPPPTSGAQVSHSPHPGTAPTQNNAYDMQPMVNNLPQMAINNQVPINAHIPMSGQNPQQSEAPHPMTQQMQSHNNGPTQPIVAEAPLISFD